MELPIIIVELGQRRQRLTLKKFLWNIDQLIELFSQAFQVTLNLQNYEIFFENQRLHSTTKLDFTHWNNYRRFQIRSTASDDAHEIALLKQRLKKASTQITDVAVIINSIRANYRNLIEILVDDSISDNPNQTVSPNFQPLSDDVRLNTSPQDSQSTDEGIDRDAGSFSIFESAHSDHDFKSIYLECREDPTVVHRSNNTQLEWRQQSYRSRPHWTSYNKNAPTGKPASKKTNKPPLPVEKKKNIPCKYAAGGNCKRGSQCRFIHVV